MIIDNKLKFNKYSDYIASKIYKSIRVLYRIKYFVPWSILISLYKTLILPYLSFYISIWGRTCDTHSDQITKLQKEHCALFVINNFGNIPMIFLLAAIFSNSMISMNTILLFTLTNLSNMKCYFLS